MALMITGGKGLAFAFIAALSLQGCTENINVNPAARDAADTCGSHLDGISAARRTEINQQANNAMAGAVIGAILGAALAGSDNAAQGALLGATAGGLAGFSATYYKQKAANASDQRALLASINTDAQTEQALVTRTGQTVASLRNCRSNQVTALSEGIRSGRIDKATGQRELTILKRRISVDNQVISAAYNGIGERVDSYVDASAAASEVDRAAYLAARQSRTTTPSVVAVTQSHATQQQLDAKMRASLNADVLAIEKLLG